MSEVAQPAAPAVAQPATPAAPAQPAAPAVPATPAQPAAPAASPAAPAPVAPATGAQPQVPASYDLSAAGFDAEVTAGLAEQARAAGLTQEVAAAQAKSLAQFVHGLNERANKAAIDSAAAQLRADPEFGGANYDASLAAAKEAALALFGEAAANNPAFGNDPAVIKGLLKLHKAGLVKGEFVAGGNARGGGEKSSAAIFYGDSMK